MAWPDCKPRKRACAARFPGGASNNIPTRSASEGFGAGPRWRFGLVCSRQENLPGAWEQVHSGGPKAQSCTQPRATPRVRTSREKPFLRPNEPMVRRGCRRGVGPLGRKRPTPIITVPLGWENAAPLGQTIPRNAPLHASPSHRAARESCRTQAGVPGRIASLAANGGSPPRRTTPRMKQGHPTLVCPLRRSPHPRPPRQIARPPQIWRLSPFPRLGSAHIVNAHTRQQRVPHRCPAPATAIRAAN